MVNEILAPAAAGAAAGLGVALPLGAIAALLLREGIVNGFRVAAAAAAGIATVDLLYCAVATATGTLLARAVEHHRAVFPMTSGLLIVTIGIKQLHRGMQHRADSAPDVRTVSARAAYARFFVLTAINPMTLVYFIALGGAVTAPGGSWTAPAAFVAAAGLSSLVWQLVLAAAGAFLHGTVGTNTTRIIGIVASLLILALGIGVVANGIGALAHPTA